MKNFLRDAAAYTGVAIAVVVAAFSAMIIASSAIATVIVFADGSLPQAMKGMLITLIGAIIFGVAIAAAKHLGRVTQRRDSKEKAT